jgi:hypothetical protein
MSLSKLRQIRRLKTLAAPVIAERDRRVKEWMESLPSLAEKHLLRVILVFRYGEPRIDEPLALAYHRALSKANDPPRIVDPLGKGNSSPIESLALDHFRTILEREPPEEDIKQKISTWVKQMPDWLRHLCSTRSSMGLLKLESPPLGEDRRKFYRTKSDRRAWPMLPQGMLKPAPDYGNEDYRIIEQMSAEEAMTFITIHEKPEEEWTRRERRFVDEVFARKPKD